jgi:hypothetical protein
MRSERWIALLAAFVPLVLCSDAPGQAVRIDKILVKPGTPVVQLIVEADGPLASARGYYLPGSPSTFVLDVGGAKTTETPEVPASEARFIRDIQVQKEGPQNLLVLARLSERVFVRLRREARRTVVEFAKIQGYSLDAKVQAQLAGRPRGRIFLDGIEPSDVGGSVSFRIRLTTQAVAQVFSLEKPWRLVVDIYDTLLRAKPPVWTTEDPRVPVERVRAGQFRVSGPRPITRLVFDLREPCVYSLDTDTDGFVVSFFKNMSLNAAVATPPTSAPAPPASMTAPAPGPAPRQGPAMKAAASAPAENPSAPLVRMDLLRLGGKDIAPPRRDIFRPNSYGRPALQSSAPGPAGRTLSSKEPPAFALNLVYVGSVRSGGKIMALVTSDGQTLPVAVGDEIIPGYKVLRITVDEIEVEGPKSQRKTFSRQGGRP